MMIRTIISEQTVTLYKMIHQNNVHTGVFTAHETVSLELALDSPGTAISVLSGKLQPVKQCVLIAKSVDQVEQVCDLDV